MTAEQKMLRISMQACAQRIEKLRQSVEKLLKTKYFEALLIWNKKTLVTSQTATKRC
jgi:uncharacterized 2Fe-2S/4Fe-4S cluster protein (DUF4445 family)